MIVAHKYMYIMYTRTRRVFEQVLLLFIFIPHVLLDPLLTQGLVAGVQLRVEGRTQGQETDDLIRVATPGAHGSPGRGEDTAGAMGPA